MRKVATFILIATCCCAFWHGTPTLYVSPSGNDSNLCSISQPCLTIAHAQTVARTQKASVVLRDGTYTIPATLAFTSSDSGTVASPVIYQSYPGEHAIINAGTVVTGWSLFSGSIFRANVGTSVDFRQLYVNGVHVQRARGPANPAGWTPTAGGYTAPDSTVAGYGNLTNVEIVSIGNWAMLRCLVLSGSGTTITMQTPCWTIRNAKSPGYGWASVAWVENAFELMASGSWYLDRSAGFLYYWPPGGSMSGLTVTAPTVTDPITITGVSNFQLKNLTVSYSNWVLPNSGGVGYTGNISGARWTDGTSNPSSSVPMDAAITVTGSTNIMLSHLELSHLGSAAVSILDGNSNVAVTSSRIDDIAGLPINVGRWSTCPGVQENAVTIQYNLVPAGSQFDYTDSAVAFFICSKNTVVDHNELDGAHSFPIFFGFAFSNISQNANSSVTNNIFGNGCDTYTDCGGIYSSDPQSAGSTFPTGLNVSGNFWNGNGGAFIGFSCIYPDELSSWNTYTGNVCRVSAGFVHMAFADTSNITITGNYSDSSSILNNATGGGITISGNTFSTSGAAALAIIAAAGVPSNITPGVQ